MGIFDLFKTRDINEGVEEYKNTEGAVLIDVREADEFRSGHIPGAKNIPLSTIGNAESLLPDKEKTLFLYCLSGGRSGQACSYLKGKGYTDVKNIGGIGSYSGEIEK